jgi:hypothetical protein
LASADVPITPSKLGAARAARSAARGCLLRDAHTPLVIAGATCLRSRGRGWRGGQPAMGAAWLIVVAVGLAPMLPDWVVSIIVLAIGRTTRRRRAESPAGLAAGTGARAKGRSSSRASGEAAEPHSPADPHVALPVAARAPGTSPAEPPTCFCPLSGLGQRVFDGRCRTIAPVNRPAIVQR